MSVEPDNLNVLCSEFTQSPRFTFGSLPWPLYVPRPRREVCHQDNSQKGLVGPRELASLAMQHPVPHLNLSWECWQGS